MRLKNISDNPIEAAKQFEEYWNSRHEKYIWLGPGWHWRKNENFNIVINKKEGFEEIRESISIFYNHYIFKKKLTTLDQCCITQGCVEGINSGIKYFRSKSNKKILYLTPTFKELLELSNKSERIEINQYNESWNTTYHRIKNIIDKEDIGCIVIANPNNPSGIMYPKSFLKNLAKLCNHKSIWILEDGAYFLHCHKSSQTSVIEYFDYAISIIGSTKLFLSFDNKENKIGGAVLSKKLNPKDFSRFVDKIPLDRQNWFNHLLDKVIKNTVILKEHLDYSYNIAKKVKKEFIRENFKPLYYSIFLFLKKTPTGPVMSFGYKNKNGNYINSKDLFIILANYKIITQMITPKKEEKIQGLRLNTRAIYNEELQVLRNNLQKAKQELNKY
jgi:hypothetical protein